MTKNRTAVLCASAASLLLAGTAIADVPALEINWSVNDRGMNNVMPSGNDNGDGTYTYIGSDLDFNTGVTLDYNLTGKPDPRLSGNIVIENTTLDTIDVFLEVLLPINPTLDASAWAGSAALGLTTDAGGGTLSTLAGTPLWQALSDGAHFTSLFDDPFSISIAGLGSDGAAANFGIPDRLLGGPVNNTIGIELNFSLTALDQFSLTSVLDVIVPGPGGLMLAVAGLAVVGRRRRR